MLNPITPNDGHKAAAKRLLVEAYDQFQVGRNPSTLIYKAVYRLKMARKDSLSPWVADFLAQVSKGQTNSFFLVQAIESL